MPWKLLCFILLITTVLSQNTNISDAYLEGLFSELFTTPNSQQVPNIVVPTNPSFLPGRGVIDAVTRPASVPLPVSTVSHVDLEYGIEKACTGGICLPYYLCNNTDGDGIIDIRIGTDDECHYLEVCCSDENIQPLPTDESYVDNGCGHRRNGIGNMHVIEKNGESQYGEFPWMVAILREEQVVGRSLKTYLCGGSLIHPQVILTAAHCVYGRHPHELIVRLGEWDTQTNNELYPHQDRNITEVVIHEAYVMGPLFNDIALLFMNNGVDLAENVNTLCLPPKNIIFDGSRCMASGWGKDVFGLQGKFQVIMKKIEIPIVGRLQCLQSLRTTRLGRRFQLHNSFICAGGEPGKDTCKGDGGSPLVCPIPGTDNRYYHVGIVAWGIGCGENQVPGVYVNVPVFREWIDIKFNSKGLDTSYYIP